MKTITIVFVKSGLQTTKIFKEEYIVEYIVSYMEHDAKHVVTTADKSGTV